MRFQVTLTPSADEDLKHYRAFEQRAIVDAMKVHLRADANVETRRRKRMAGHPVAPWELRVGNCRVFYELEAETRVKVVAVGHKEHNDLFIRGKMVNL